MKKIPLTQGQFALVDDEDFGWLSKRKWFSQRCKERFYAASGHKNEKMHRILLDAKPGQYVDHKNNDSLDNRKKNLRFATKAENARNRGKPAGKQSSKFKGVYWEKGKNRWIASITVNYKQVKLGRFKTEDQAARAYNKASKKMHKEFSRGNDV